MKTVKVVAAVIHKEDKIFATQRGYGTYKDGWSSLAEKLKRVRHQSRL